MQAANAALQQKSQELRAETAGLRERVNRLEALRDGDHAQMLAEIARFKAEVELTLLRAGHPNER